MWIYWQLSPVRHRNIHKNAISLWIYQILQGTEISGKVPYPYVNILSYLGHWDILKSKIYEKYINLYIYISSPQKHLNALRKCNNCMFVKGIGNFLREKNISLFKVLTSMVGTWAPGRQGTLTAPWQMGGQKILATVNILTEDDKSYFTSWGYSASLGFFSAKGLMAKCSCRAIST